MTDTGFDIEKSRRYWRFAPSGAGKHDTVDLAAVDDGALLREWKDAFSRRFSNYLEEDRFLAVMGDAFRGKKVLSIGSGLGLHEIYYAAHGAAMTCCDIVPSNLNVIRRVSARLGVEVDTFVLREPKDIRGPYDVIFIYGSLMTMPEDRQRALLDACASALGPQGSIVLMLYTWAFARATCGWRSPAEFDPAVFARASDPSVGEEHCPWSDWHDDEKLLRIAPTGFHIRRRQFWQQGWFVWYELSRSTGAVTEFFDPASVVGVPLFEMSLADFTAADAALAMEGRRLRIVTGENLASYAGVAPPVQPRGANAISIEAEIRDGAFSVGVYDASSGTFIATHVVNQPGAHRHVMSVPAFEGSAQLILSNFRDEAAQSEFLIRKITWSRRESASGAFVNKVSRGA